MYKYFHQERRKKKGQNRAVFPNKPSPSLSVYLKSDGTDRPLIILSYNQQMQGLRICDVNLSPSEIFIRKKIQKSFFSEMAYSPGKSISMMFSVDSSLC